MNIIKKEKFELFTSCDEAQHSCDKIQYNEATLLEKVRLNVHLIFCRACQKYTANNNKLTKVMNKEKIETFNSSEKIDMESAFQQQLKNSQSNQ